MHLPTRVSPASAFVRPESTTLVEVCRYRAVTQPTDDIYTFVDETGEHTVTYAQLDTEVRAVAARLQRELAPGDRALLMYPPGREYVVGFLACLYAGVVAVPAYPPDVTRLGRTLPRLLALVADCGARVALTTEGIASLVGPLTEGREDLRALRWLATDGVPVEEAASWRELDLRPDTVAFLQYTSGSTGTPRGVVLGHRQLLHNSELISRGFNAKPDPRFVSWLPPYHDMGLIAGIIHPLFRDMPSSLMPPLYFLQRPMRWLEVISRHGGTVSGGPNFAFDLCVRKSTPEERAALDLSRWEVAYCGAEPVRAETMERFAQAFAPGGFRRQALYPCYGLAEGTLIVTGRQRAEDREDVLVVRDYSREGLERGEARPPSPGEEGAALVSCGEVLGVQEVRVVDPGTREVVPAGRVGELWVRGPSVAEGYWQRPEETERDFNGRLAGSAEGPFLRTGDLAIVEDGEVFITGRLKDVLILRGRNLYPQDLELTVERSHPALRPGCGVAFPVQVHGEERLVVVQEVAAKAVEGGAVDDALARIQAALTEEHGVAAHAVVLITAGSLPKTSSGKVQRRVTRRTYLDGALEVVKAWRESDVDSRDAESVSPESDEVLGWLAGDVAWRLGSSAEALDADAPLTRYGLDSLRGLDVMHAIQRRWGVSLPPTFLLQGPSLREVAAKVEQERGAAVQPVSSSTPALGDVSPHVSDGQRALWFLQRLAPGGTAYHIARAMRLAPDVDLEVLARVFAELAARHPALACAFPEERGEPVWRSAAAPVMERESASGWSDAALRERLDAESQRPFDLEHGPLMRVRVFTGVETGPVLLLVFHHLITDFWSLEVLAEELGVLYTAGVRGVPAELPPPPPMAGPILREREARLTGARGEALQSWWRERLGGELPVLELPTSKPRPRLQSFRGAAVSFQVEADTASRLLSLAGTHGATPFMVLLAGYVAFLRRYTGQEDLVVGTPTTGRAHADLSRQLSYFVNPVALRARVPRGQSFTSLLKEVRGLVLEALEHQELPFARMVERLQPRRDAARAPVFQTMFVLHAGRPGREALAPFALGGAGTRVRLGALELESVPLRNQASAFDLTLTMAESEGGFAASLEYCTDLFDAALAERMVRHFRTLLDAAAREPEVPVLDLPLLEGEEQRVLLAAGRRATASEEPSARSLHGAFEAAVARSPDAVALVSGTSRWTYGEVDAWAERLGARLRQRGVGPEVRVGVLLERGHPGTVIAFLAVLKAGGTVVPCEPSHPPERIAWMLRDAGARGLLVQERLSRRLDLSSDVLRLLWEELGGHEPRAEDVRTDAPSFPSPECSAYVIYTSGSTGRPKGVVVTHRGALHLAESMGRGFGLGAGDRVLQFASPAFDASIAEYLQALLTGAALHLPPSGELLAGEALHRVLKEERITLVTLPPSACALLPEAPLPDLRRLVSAGESCPEDLVSRFAPGRTFVNAYGPTEATVCSTWAICQPGEGTPDIGRPLPAVDAYVLDEALNPVPRGVAGELCVGGPMVARGYLGRPDLTAERFVPDPHGGAPGGRLYRTGDVARWRPDGRLELLGRVDAQVKLRGFRIEPGEVEAVLRELARMRQAHVRVWRPPSGGEARLVAYVVPPEEGLPPPGELKASLRARLPEYLVPADFVALEALPLLSSGKVDVRALPPPMRMAPAEGAPRTPLEEALSRAWAETLGFPAVGVHSHFFDDLGGSSLAAVRACARIRESLGRDVPITHFFEHPTVHALARRLSSDSEPGTQAVKHQERAEARRQVLQRRGGRNT
ncbi:non-ribosomal peptide synthetase [Myxococcus stipitatus DSM 14675]|uniref:Non-ribosomal peptide synthetase n=1 Tax=Myxococcus stipitatus (strain DSM 14675 / JCM 12634 / Mx s8) TaxID=1278073 RepID=L7UC95_MYXSD|nr:non-ribosomal peptide synthetase [Myxococcus stipitatus]AGC45222.1 non-ribosomal peptide synthetase [Myxococcus stipitatus DSM 14675]